MKAVVARVSLALALVALGGASIAAEETPAQPLRIIVPLSAGSAFDILARAMGNAFKERTQQPVIVENRPGGNMGLAIRLKPGERLANTQGAVRLTRGNRPGDNVWLLYGPSVNQVLRDVATRDTPAILRNVSLEFLRQWQLLGKS